MRRSVDMLSLRNGSGNPETRDHNRKKNDSAQQARGAWAQAEYQERTCDENEYRKYDQGRQYDRHLAWSPHAPTPAFVDWPRVGYIHEPMSTSPIRLFAFPWGKRAPLHFGKSILHTYD